MNKDRLVEPLALSIGAILVATGFTLAGFYAFRNRFLMVFAGFMVFVAGYKLSWYGVNYWDSFTEIKTSAVEVRHRLPPHLEKNLWNYLLIAAGVLSSAYGTTMFAQIVLSFETSKAILAGLFSFGGYMVAHEGVNKVLV